MLVTVLKPGQALLSIRRGAHQPHLGMVSTLFPGTIFAFPGTSRVFLGASVPFLGIQGQSVEAAYARRKKIWPTT
jgi:hypothetical protein